MRASVTSHNNHVTLLTNLSYFQSYSVTTPTSLPALVPPQPLKHCNHSFTMTPEIPGAQFNAQTQMSSSTDPNISVYSIVLTSCSFPTSHSCVSHSCTHCLAVFQSHTSDILILMAMLSDSIYKTQLCMYLTCSNIDFDYCFHCLLDLWSLLTSL